MLVLSRKVNETILFPELDVKIEVLNVKGKSIRVGVDAPIEIKVVRGELSADDSEEDVAQTFTISGVSEHDVRNKLNAFNIAVSLAKKLIERGRFNQAASRLQEVFEDIQNGYIEEDPESSECVALLVEDVDNEREMLAGFLRLHGYQVDTVADGLAAIDYLTNNPKPDLIMLDIGMPKMNGAELISQIRQNAALDDVKLFAISGSSPRQAKVNLSKNRISKWFQKPLRPASLISEINREFSDSAECN